MLKVAIIGLGTMGPGMAGRLARGGVEVRAYDVADAALDRARAAMPQVDAVLDRLGIAPPAGGAGTVAFHGDLAEAVAGADLVIENVPERVEVKEQVLRALCPLVADDCVIATDTSGIPIGTLQAFVTRPGRFIGMHWSNPPHIIPMIEVIPGAATEEATAAFVTDTIRALGLIPVRVRKDVPGFVENRVLYALLRECVDLVDRGVIDPEDLDTCVSWGIGYKLSVIGPMALLDMAGLDIYQSVSSYLNADLCNAATTSATVRERTAAGRLGIKSGGGMYEYTPERIRELQAERARTLVAARLVLEGKSR
ncbi:5-formyl-3-hydroxy-2-methylpyridine 4-carboxylate 5-dehydrogenase [Azospirillum sp. ST 5-10]|uniref:5-formyl-3-hydroxy-2-methylpyridine 4-carboxylate 5-dehydrogenase n=1 Tax=unclassified Azospirillum TaxID=2630922 RepID=UPI003F4A2740